MLPNLGMLGGWGGLRRNGLAVRPSRTAAEGTAGSFRPAYHPHPLRSVGLSPLCNTVYLFGLPTN